MGVSEILDGAFKLLRANARTMALLVITLAIPLDFAIAFLERNINGGSGFLRIFSDPSSSSQSSSGTSLGVSGIALLVSIFLLPLVCAGASRVVLTSYLGGEMKPQAALLAVLKRSPAILVAVVIVHLAEAVGVIGFVVGAVFVMPLFVLVAPAISLEELGPFAGIKRSFTLVSRRYWPTLGIALLAGLLAAIIGDILGLVPSLLALVVGLRWGWLIIGAASVFQSFITVSIITIVATLLYLDARIRKEGLDLQVLAARLER
ncbi:MAG TPA: hypothetical protein VHT30_06075 [Acidimicrobiales bacterium]|jgi:hypothetical protein|nr:hypothetical protein [Acidimicrobiales bacterium]